MSPKETQSQPRVFFKYYDLIVAVMVGALLISNLGAVKLISFGPIITDGGAILFPLTYILGDILTEVYGYKYARRAIWISFIMMAAMVLVLTAVRLMPGASMWDGQAAFDTVHGFMPRIVAASLLAFLAGEFLNAFVLAKMKLRSGGKNMWQRLIGSTVVGETVDTTIFGLVAFGGILGGSDMLKFIAIGVVFKTLVEIVMLPVTYRIIRWLKRRERADSNDDRTNFTPLSLTLQ